MNTYCSNNKDDIIMPTPETYKEMIKIAEECKILVEERKQYELELFEQRNKPINPEERKSLYEFLINCLMYNLFADEWTNLDATSKNYDTMSKYYQLAKNAMEMNSIQQAYSSADMFETSVMNLFDSIIARYHLEQTKVANYQLTSTLWSVLSTVLPIAFSIPAPVIILGVGLIRTQGFIGAFEVMTNATKLGINTFGVSINALSWGINVTSKLLKL